MAVALGRLPGLPVLQGAGRGDVVTPTGRSLGLLRQSGYTADICERWVPHTQHRRDLFGFGDIIAVRPGAREFLIVQATTAAHVAHRLAKAQKLPALAAWLRAGGAFEVWGWFSRDGRWHVRRVAVRPEDLAAVVLQGPQRRRQRRGERQRELFSDSVS